MFRITQKSTRTLPSTLSAWAAILLVIVYGVGSLEFNSIHSLFHSEAEVHSVANEKEACHKAIYHGSSNGCHHKSHFASNDKCPLCHLNFHSAQLLSDVTFDLPVATASKTEVYLISVFIASFEASLQARAPPIC